MQRLPTGGEQIKPGLAARSAAISGATASTRSQLSRRSSRRFGARNWPSVSSEALADDSRTPSVGGNGRHDEGRIGQRRKIDEDDPIRKDLPHLHGDRDRQSRLAGPARPGQGDKSDVVAAQGRARGPDFPLPPDEPGQGRWHGEERRHLGSARRRSRWRDAPRPATPPGPPILPQRVRQHAHRFEPRGGTGAALQVADAAHAEAAARGQLLLGKRSRAAHLAEQAHRTMLCLSLTGALLAVVMSPIGDCCRGVTQA